jgi:hypothetical protein
VWHGGLILGILSTLGLLLLARRGSPPVDARQASSA